MKTIFRKAMTVLGSAALLGATVGTAAAAAYPAPFTSNSAIVVGANADAADFTAATNIASALDATTAGSVATTLTGGDTVTEDEVTLGGTIVSGKIDANITDSDLPSLIDGKISWDDGHGSDDIDVHEEIAIMDMTVKTSLADEDFEGVALTNEMGLMYRYTFDDSDLNWSGITNSASDTLYLTLLGKQYEVSAMDPVADSITVVTSEEVSLAIGESVTVDGKTFTVDDVFDGKAQINGEVISETQTEKVDGVQVNVDTVGYHSNAPELSKVILKIGEDISKTYTNGDEFIGEDEDDPLWVWDISLTNTSQVLDANSYIGVKYNVNINDADDEEAGDSIKYAEDGYMFPDNFAQVTLDGTTDVTYEDIKLSFMEKDLYSSSDSGSANEDEKVIVISGETTETITVGGEETDEIYIWYANNGSATELANSAFGGIEIFYRDHDGDNTPTNKARFEKQVNLTANGTLTSTEVASIEVGDTTIGVNVEVVGGSANLIFVADQEDIILNIGGANITNTAGNFDRLGDTEEDADAQDINVTTTDVSTKDESVMTTYGIIIAEEDSDGVEGNANADEVTLSVPDEQVYAIVSVTAGGSASSDGGEAGIMTYKDTESASFAGKNLVVVGGSAINSVAAELLGGAYAEAEFTAMTGVAAGQFMIESYDRSGKTALLVAGYNAEDTTKAANALLNSDVDTTVGMKYVSSETTVSETDLVTA